MPLLVADQQLYWEKKMRQKVIAGNWKMNLTLTEAVKLTVDIRADEPTYKHQVILCPAFPYLSAMQNELKGSNIKLGAQNCADKESGAFTGEVSAQMLASMSVTYVIIGHSERRIYYHESHEVLKEKINLAMRHGLLPIFCCGETEKIRKDEKQDDFVGLGCLVGFFVNRNLVFNVALKLRIARQFEFNQRLVVRAARHLKIHRPTTVVDLGIYGTR